ncbi:phospholipase D-like domain-containing protein [Rubrobacter indicoceani]|uniref:phospholipase D-like domain-containing protein n=1 Tax=Rubrobacter indicoceani TaxID=2051957 RepID=UPI001F09CD74|nr:phospholipase D-like domain-containing protein [Rubrobacter indicoceani]
MFFFISLLRDIAGIFSGVGRILRAVRGLFVRFIVVLTVFQVASIAVLTFLSQLRKRREGPGEGFPWAEHDEIETEQGEGKLKVFPFGVRLYEEMLREIEGAEKYVYLETFIWKGDELGQRFVDALAKKAREGVSVYVIFDGFANLVVSREFKNFPDEIHLLNFRPMKHAAEFVNPRTIFRDHRKILCVDGRVAFMGGYNIGKLYAAGWRDTHLRIRGSEVNEIENAFVDFWNTHHGADRLRNLPRIEPTGGRAWNSHLVLHRNDPYMRIFPIRAVYLEAIDRASRNIYLTHAYFIPDRAMRAGLIEAARRGVDVQIVLPRESNHITADWLGRRYFYELLEVGVKIHRYKHIMIHSKTATIDGKWSTIGTANIDRLSLLGNYEVNLEIYSEKLAADMEEMFELDKTNCEELTREEWERRPLAAKVVERALESLGPLV